MFRLWAVVIAACAAAVAAELVTLSGGNGVLQLALDGQGGLFLTQSTALKKLSVVDLGGDAVWTHAASSWLASSVALSADGGVVFLCEQGSTGQLVAVSAASGAELWRVGFTYAGKLVTVAVGPGGGVYVSGFSGQYGDGGTFLVARFEATLAAGSRLWTATTSGKHMGGYNRHHGLAVSGSAVFAAYTEPTTSFVTVVRLMKVRVTDGESLWTKRMFEAVTTTKSCYGQFLAMDSEREMLFLSGFCDNDPVTIVQRLSTSDGSVLWSYSHDAPRAYYLQAASAVSCDGHVFLLDYASTGGQQTPQTTRLTKLVAASGVAVFVRKPLLSNQNHGGGVIYVQTNLLLDYSTDSVVFGTMYNQLIRNKTELGPSKCASFVPGDDGDGGGAGSGSAFSVEWSSPAAISVLFIVVFLVIVALVVWHRRYRRSRAQFREDGQPSAAASNEVEEGAPRVGLSSSQAAIRLTAEPSAPAQLPVTASAPSAPPAEEEKRWEEDDAEEKKEGEPEPEPEHTFEFELALSPKAVVDSEEGDQPGEAPASDRLQLKWAPSKK